ncbi:MAG: hypothetical protein KAJ95_08825, partial [Gammaproteobacteria bacterium]|nr:hypothetical protein [Gammaproteobacteria bacterium]
MIKKYIELHGIKIICMIAAIVSVSIADASASGHRDKPVSITEAKWESGDGRLVIKGRNAGKRGTVEIYNASSNALLDTVVADKRGKWKSEPDTAPCGVRAVSHDTSDEKMVLDAPANCDGASGDDNQPPLAVNDTAATNQNTEISINVVSNDRDTDGSIV